MIDESDGEEKKVVIQKMEEKTIGKGKSFDSRMKEERLKEHKFKKEKKKKTLSMRSSIMVTREESD